MIRKNGMKATPASKMGDGYANSAPQAKKNSKAVRPPTSSKTNPKVRRRG